MPFAYLPEARERAPPVVVVCTPVAGHDAWDLQIAAAAWFWDQGMRGGDVPAEASAPLCVVDGQVPTDAAFELQYGAGARIAVVVCDNCWDRRTPETRYGPWAKVAHVDVSRAGAWRRRADKDIVGIPHYVELVTAPEMGLKAGMALFTALAYPAVLGYAYPGPDSVAWAEVYGSDENRPPAE